MSRYWARGDVQHEQHASQRPIGMSSSNVCSYLVNLTIDGYPRFVSYTAFRRKIMGSIYFLNGVRAGG